jgi:hypothetical protein
MENFRKFSQVETFRKVSLYDVRASFFTSLFFTAISVSGYFTVISMFL